MNKKLENSAKGILSLVGNTPLLKVQTLSELSGCEIFVKCENFNPGGTVKDRPAVNMVVEAIASGALKPGMTIVEGTAGNTGIGLAMVGQVLGYKVKVVMPKGQDASKLKQLALYGADTLEVDVVPFTDDNHFFKVAKKIGESDPNYWWANQFDNLHNFDSHYKFTGPEIFSQMNGEVDYFISAAGTGGTIAGVSCFLKQMNPKTQVYLVDPHGSGLKNYFHTKEFKIEGTYSMTEGVGITRLVENFKKAKIDNAYTFEDQPLVSLAYYLKQHEGLVMGMSSMLNLACTFKAALSAPKNSRLVTFMCDGGDRAINKMYNADFLKEHKYDSKLLNAKDLVNLFSNL